MFNLENLFPKSETDDEIKSWTEYYSNDYSSRNPECAAHHTYIDTVPVNRYKIWICPSCGRLSDACAPHTGGTHITGPLEIGTTDLIAIFGQATVQPSDGDRDYFGDATMRAVLVQSDYDAKEDIKKFKNDIEWTPGGGDSRRIRRWVPELGVWAVQHQYKNAFISHMEDRDWIVLDLLRPIETQQQPAQ